VTPSLTRRSLIGAGMAFAFGARALDALGAEAEGASTCLLTPEVTEGPYWIDYRISRHDVRDGKPGLPLLLGFTVVNAKTSKPIPGADVEIWHADAAGEYSGFDHDNPSFGGPGGPVRTTSTTRYLRGHQKADAAGRASFLTIFPGWYPGRAPHVHLKVHVGGVGGRVVHTGQVFFDPRLADGVYRQGAYAKHGEPDTTNTSDQIYEQAGGSRAVVKLGKRTGGGYPGRIVIGVAF
jgi:protocatechuate 3,4-dioxygenase beta subunit